MFVHLAGSENQQFIAVKLQERLYLHFSPTRAMNMKHAAIQQITNNR